MTDALITVPELRRELPFDGEALGVNEAEFEDTLEDHLERAQDRVEEWIQTPLTVETATAAVSRPNGAEPHDLPLHETPVQSVESLSINEWRADGPAVDMDDVIVHDTHLELKPEAERDEWPTDRRSVEVSWEYGFDEVPADLRTAVIRLVRLRLRQVDADGFDSESVFGDSVSFADNAETMADIHRDTLQYEPESYFGGAMVV